MVFFVCNERTKLKQNQSVARSRFLRCSYPRNIFSFSVVVVYDGGGGGGVDADGNPPSFNFIGATEKRRR